MLDGVIFLNAEMHEGSEGELF